MSYAVALLYHDVVPSDNTDSSGLVTNGSWRYKISPSDFRQHLSELDDLPYNPTLFDSATAQNEVYLCFDDGGASAVRAAGILEEFGFRGHFFIITDRIGENSFVTEDDIKRLSDAGHSVGSHTTSHPDLVPLSADEREKEFRNSKNRIEDLIGECSSISIPMGSYTPQVLDEAEDVYDTVFTSEPTFVKGPEKARVGRWNIWHDTTANELRQIVTANWRYRFQIQARWFSLKAIKRVIGRDRFVTIRDTVSTLF